MTNPINLDASLEGSNEQTQEAVKQVDTQAPETVRKANTLLLEDLHAGLSRLNFSEDVSLPTRELTSHQEYLQSTQGRLKRMDQQTQEIGSVLRELVGMYRNSGGGRLTQQEEEFLQRSEAILGGLPQTIFDLKANIDKAQRVAIDPSSFATRMNELQGQISSLRNEVKVRVDGNNDTESKDPKSDLVNTDESAHRLIGLSGTLLEGSEEQTKLLAASEDSFRRISSLVGDYPGFLEEFGRFAQQRLGGEFGARVIGWIRRMLPVFQELQQEYKALEVDRESSKSNLESSKRHLEERTFPGLRQLKVIIDNYLYGRNQIRAKYGQNQIR